MTLEEAIEQCAKELPEWWRDWYRDRSNGGAE